MRKLMFVLIVVLLCGLFRFSAQAQTPLSTPILGQLPPPGYGAIATTRPLPPPPTYAPPTVRPSITPTPMWREVYYVRGYTPLWLQPARQYYPGFEVLAPGWYLMVENRGYWLIILNCSHTPQFTVPCPYESMWVQNDWNVLKQ